MSYASQQLGIAVVMKMLPPMRVTLLVVLCCLSILRAADLESRLDAIAASAPKGAEVGIALIDTTDGSVLYRRHADAAMTLASTTKVLVAGAALLQLGPDYQFVTKLVALGPIANGAVPGVGVIGGGDPTLDEHSDTAINRDPDTILANWAEQLKKRGVRRIVGDLVIDNRLFSGPIRPDTYPTDKSNAVEWFSAPASAFAFNDNCIEAKAIPTELGDPAQIITRPASPRIPIVNKTRSMPGKKTSVIVNRDQDSNRLILSGDCGKALGWLKPVAIFSDPDLLAGDNLKRVLTAEGVPVSGAVKLGEVDANGTVLVERRQPIIPALEIMLKRSQNFYGEQIVRLVGRARGGDGSIIAGTKASMECLRERLGDAAPRAKLLDGSGLSYGNAASAQDMARYLHAMLKTPVGEVFYRSLLEKSPAGVRAKVKTGTLAVSRTLVGYLEAPGKRWAFAILCNQGDSASIWWAVTLREKVLEEMAKAIRR